MRTVLLFLALAVASSAAVKRPAYGHRAKQQVAKPHAPKGRRNKVKGRKAPKPRRRTN